MENNAWIIMQSTEDYLWNTMYLICVEYNAWNTMYGTQSFGMLGLKYRCLAQSRDFYLFALLPVYIIGRSGMNSLYVVPE